ncbi:penicillin-binding protein [Candidatus Saccharibacteria bacterium]|nr:penicillin-binding protein [Candidatus Saccharibacteria bacterium]
MVKKSIEKSGQHSAKRQGSTPRAARRAKARAKKAEKKQAIKRDLKNMSFGERVRYKRKLRKDREARRRAEDLASLPKQPVLRFFAHFHPKRVFRYWFSWRGLKKIFKFGLACILLGVILVGALFLYYKKDINDIKLSDIVISETVNTYLDRNGVVLWEDTGSENYRLVVEGDQISDYVRKATVAIEDKNFYNHPGVDLSGLVRAVFNTLSGRAVQGGSTLTQQLIKQVYFADEAASENRGGIARKIKELILAIELEKMYDKEQIITMYLNESPYGGRRNGIESAAQTYFRKSAKDLTLAESALLAGIPNNPAVLNPYNTYGNEMLIERQHRVLDRMAELGYITPEEAEEAKEVAILDTIQPEGSQYENMLAPHFVLEVKSQLEDKYGYSTMRSGGFTIKTTLDYNAQKIAEDAVAYGQSISWKNNSDNIALVSLDVETSQVVAMVGSVDFNNPVYGSYNAATSLIEPGSTIKPILDYAPLFMQRSGQNFGPGTILKDENIDAIYCKGNVGRCALRNASQMFYGNKPIRYSLAQSLNIAAVKALYINGVENSLEVAHKLGDVSYCAGQDYVGLSVAIGSGCNVRLHEHANAYASLARGGSYKDIVYVLEVKNSSGDVLESWEDTAGERVVDEQVAYMVTNILSDRQSRYWNNEGFVIPGVWTATKTGTTTTTSSSETKDSLMVSYSTSLVSVVWNGNHDGSGLSSNTHDIARFVTYEYMRRVHPEVYEPAGKWVAGSEAVRPAGIQTLTVNGITDIWPSWYNEKTSGVTKETMQFNRYTKKRAAVCTNAAYIVEVEVTKTVDPMTKNEVYNVPDGYDRDTEDDCAYTPPSVSIAKVGKHISVTVNGSQIIGGNYTVTTNSGLTKSGTISSATFYADYQITGDEGSITVTVSDKLGQYATSSAITIPAPAQPVTPPSPSDPSTPETDD